MCRGGLDGVLPSPLPRGGLVSRAIGLVDVGNFGHQRIVGVRVGKHGANGEKNCDGDISSAYVHDSCITSCLQRGARRLLEAGRVKEKMSLECLTFANGQRRAPLVPQDVQTDAAVAVDVGMIDAGGEVDLWWLERVVGREVDCKEEDAAGVWRVAGSHDGRLPVKLSGETYVSVKIPRRGMIQSAARAAE